MFVNVLNHYSYSTLCTFSFIISLNVEVALGEEAEQLAETIFRVFDNDGSGTMDFQEYVMALSSSK